MKRAALALVLALPTTALAQTTVWVVDDDAGPGVDFATIQSAVDVAVSGDVILVRTGDYPNFTLAGKGVSILEDTGADARVLPPGGDVLTLVTGVPAGARAILRGLDFLPPMNVDDNPLRLESNAGLVWVEDVTVAQAMFFPFGYTLLSAEAVDVIDCDAVVFVNCELRGSAGAPQGQGLEAGAVGLETTDSDVYLFGTEVTAGGTLVSGGTGQPGVRTTGGFLSLRDSLAQGAGGGEGNPFIATEGGDGGPGLLASNTEVWSINTQLVGGPGAGDALGQSMGDPGEPFVNLGGTVTEAAANAATLTGTAVVRDTPGEVAQVDLASVPNAVVLVAVALAPDPVLVASLPEVSGVGLAPILFPAGTTDGSGAFSLVSGTPQLPPGLPTWNATVQAVLVTPLGELELSNPSLLTMVDDGV